MMIQCHLERTASAQEMEDMVVHWWILFLQDTGEKPHTICLGPGNTKLSLVQDALQCLLEELNLTSDDVFLYMCFFVNNQYRILFEKDGVGSSNLEHVFESTLNRIGHMVAILDDWYAPVYLTRIWTIFEQFTAIKLGNVKVTMVLPQQQNHSLVEQIREGEDGIRHVTQCLCKFQSKHATAFSPEDEENVKKLIRSTIGFREVDRRIEQFHACLG